LSSVRFRYSGVKSAKKESRGAHVPDLSDAVAPPLGLLHGDSNIGDEQGRKPTEREHGAPSILRAHQVVEGGGNEDPDVVAAVHDAGAHDATALRQFFDDEGRRADELSSDPETREQPENRQLPPGLRDCAEEREQGIAEDGEHEHAHAAEPIGERAPQECQSPPDEEH